jgi:hypothetical protein
MKKIITLISACMLTVGIASTWAQAQTWNIGKYNPEDVIATLEEGVLTISGSGDMKDWSSDNHIFASALSGKTITIVIQEGVTSIGASAFRGCSGFTGSLTIPGSVTSIGGNAFLDCSGFTSLTIPEGVTSIGISTFFNCSGFTGSLTIPGSVMSIGGGAFRNCSGFTSLTIPEGVTSIEASAFDGCSGFTGSLTIPGSVTSIEDGAFWGCSGFTGSLTIPEGVTSIGYGAFDDCSGFTGSLTIPEGVTSIGTFAFFNCSGFTGSLTIPSSVTSIEDYAFYGCSGFTSLTIPEGVTSIGDEAFGVCSGFTSVTNRSIIPQDISSGVFRFVNKDTLYVPFQSTELYHNAEVWKDFNIFYIVQITISSNNTAMGTVTGGGEYKESANITLTATPAEGYRFVNWTNAGVEVSTNAVYSFTATEDVVLIANFEEAEQTAITPISASGAIPVGYYSLTGSKLPQKPEHGIYIILYDNGASEVVSK